MIDIANITLYRREELAETLGESLLRRLVRDAGLRAMGNLYPDFAVEQAIRTLYSQTEGAREGQTDEHVAETARRTTVRAVPAPRRPAAVVDPVDAYRQQMADAQAGDGA